jgi:formylglycine-generating enzyme required for sulfatase activity
VVSITWDMANTFCAWLTEQLADALPAGYVLCLPTEQEWEAAARGGDGRRYPWGNDWQEDRAATEEDEETRGGRGSAPVGCYPAGVAPCGARDMAGNVWEWTASTWQSYPGATKPFTEKGSRVLRGGSYGNDRTNVRCGARYRYLPDGWLGGVGFRVVFAPRSHKDSDF